MVAYHLLPTRSGCTLSVLWLFVLFRASSLHHSFTPVGGHSGTKRLIEVDPDRGTRGNTDSLFPS